jgi:hypothetical protein
MGKKLLLGLVLAVSSVATAPRAATANGPLVDVEVGAAVPISTLQRTASPGGNIATSVGWGFGLAEGFTLDVLTTPQFSAFSIGDCEGGLPCNGDDLAGLFAWTVGPRLRLVSGKLDVFFSFEGGYYKGVAGPLDQEAGGFMFGGGFDYEICHGSSLGVFIRRHQANMDVEPRDSGNLEFLTTGIAFRHRFGAPD